MGPLAEREQNGRAADWAAENSPSDDVAAPSDSGESAERAPAGFKAWVLPGLPAPNGFAPQAPFTPARITQLRTQERLSEVERTLESLEHRLQGSEETNRAAFAMVERALSLLGTGQGRADAAHAETVATLSQLRRDLAHALREIGAAKRAAVEGDETVREQIFAMGQGVEEVRAMAARAVKPSALHKLEREMSGKIDQAVEKSAAQATEDTSLRIEGAEGRAAQAYESLESTVETLTRRLEDMQDAFDAILEAQTEAVSKSRVPPQPINDPDGKPEPAKSAAPAEPMPPAPLPIGFDGPKDEAGAFDEAEAPYETREPGSLARAYERAHDVHEAAFEDLEKQDETSILGMDELGFDAKTVSSDDPYTPEIASAAYADEEAEEPLHPSAGPVRATAARSLLDRPPLDRPCPDRPHPDRPHPDRPHPDRQARKATRLIERIAAPFAGKLRFGSSSVLSFGRAMLFGFGGALMILCAMAAFLSFDLSPFEPAVKATPQNALPADAGLKSTGALSGPAPAYEVKPRTDLSLSGKPKAAQAPRAGRPSRENEPPSR